MGYIGRETPCPDPNLFIWVVRKHGGFWRRKRGTIKKAKLNAAFKKEAGNMKISQPAAKRIVSKLKPYLNSLRPGTLTSRISGKLRKALREDGELHFRHLDKFRVQPDYKKNPLVRVGFEVRKVKDELVITIPISSGAVKRHSPLVTDYFFELIMVWGNAQKDNGLKIDFDTSKLFDITSERQEKCKLSLPIPKSPWMALVKTSCLEGTALAHAARHYDMVVVAVG